jgi:hypothetical protein
MVEVVEILDRVYMYCSVCGSSNDIIVEEAKSAYREINKFRGKHDLCEFSKKRERRFTI